VISLADHSGRPYGRSCGADQAARVGRDSGSISRAPAYALRWINRGDDGPRQAGFPGVSCAAAGRGPVAAISRVRRFAMAGPLPVPGAGLAPGQWWSVL